MHHLRLEDKRVTSHPVFFLSSGIRNEKPRGKLSPLFNPSENGMNNNKDKNIEVIILW
jgi:hypothetical protein